MTRTRRGQGGFVLPLVLGVFLLTFLVIIALLGLTFTSSRVTAAQAETAREQRAADSALETYVGQLARTAAFAPCDSVPDANTITLDEDGVGGEDELELHVHCADDLPTSGGGAGGGGELPMPVGPRVEIIGDEYAGAIGGPAGPTTLRHRGGGPLLFSSDVQVSEGAAVDGGGTGPALRLSGEYVQGAGGCDAFTGSSEIEDANNGPACDNAEAAALGIRSGSLFGPDEDPGDVEVPETCNGPVITLDPGRYDAVDTARLNDMWGPGGCSSSTTFHFTPGRYLFDVRDPDRTDDRRHALVIDNEHVRIIFGVPRGDAATARFPQACHTGRSGASLQLTGRTTIRHLAGRIAICPAFSGTGAPYPAIVQSDLAPSQPVLATVEPDLGTIFPVKDCNPNCSIETTWASTGNVPLRNAEIQFRSWESPPTHQAEREVIVVVDPASGPDCDTGWLRSGRSDNLYTTIDLMAFGSCATALQDQDESFFEGATIEIRHRYTPGAICNPLTNECITLRIDDVRLRTNVRLAAGTSASSSGAWNNPGRALQLDGAKADAPHGAECNVWPYIWPWDSRSNFCRLDRPGTHSFEVRGVDPVAEGIRSTDHVETLTVRINSAVDAPRESWAADFGDTLEDDAMRVELLLSGNRRCEAVHDGYSRSNMGLELDLTSPSGDCDGIVQTMADLRGATVALTFRTGCARPVIKDPLDGGKCFMARLPDFDRVTLAVTTDTVRSSPGARVTVDHDAAASFNAYGDVLMPRSDLDIHWEGEHTGDPLVGGFLSLGGLGSETASDAETGVVCCAAPTTATLQAKLVDPSDPDETTWRVVTEVDIALGAPLTTLGEEFRRAVLITDWRPCGRRGCIDTSVLGTTTLPGVPGGG